VLPLCDIHATALALILLLGTIQQLFFFAKYPFVTGLVVLRATKSVFAAHVIGVILLLTIGTAPIYALGMLGIVIAGTVINFVLLSAIWVAYRKRMKRETA
jgi:uncharacterized membrane protein YadS